MASVFQGWQVDPVDEILETGAMLGDGTADVDPLAGMGSEITASPKSEVNYTGLLAGLQVGRPMVAEETATPVHGRRYTDIDGHLDRAVNGRYGPRGVTFAPRAAVATAPVATPPRAQPAGRVAALAGHAPQHPAPDATMEVAEESSPTGGVPKAPAGVAQPGGVHTYAPHGSTAGYAPPPGVQSYAPRRVPTPQMQASQAQGQQSTGPASGQGSMNAAPHMHGKHRHMPTHAGGAKLQPQRAATPQWQARGQAPQAAGPRHGQRAATPQMGVHAQRQGMGAPQGQGHPHAQRMGTPRMEGHWQGHRMPTPQMGGQGHRMGGPQMGVQPQGHSARRGSISQATPEMPLSARRRASLQVGAAVPPAPARQRRRSCSVSDLPPLQLTGMADYIRSASQQREDGNKAGSRPAPKVANRVAPRDSGQGTPRDGKQSTPRDSKQVTPRESGRTPTLAPTKVRAKTPVKERRRRGQSLLAQLDRATAEKRKAERHIKALEKQNADCVFKVHEALRLCRTIMGQREQMAENERILKAQQSGVAAAQATLPDVSASKSIATDSTSKVTPSQSASSTITPITSEHASVPALEQMKQSAFGGSELVPLPRTPISEDSEMALPIAVRAPKRVKAETPRRKLLKKRAKSPRYQEATQNSARRVEPEPAKKPRSPKKKLKRRRQEERVVSESDAEDSLYGATPDDALTLPFATAVSYQLSDSNGWGADGRKPVKLDSCTDMAAMGSPLAAHKPTLDAPTLAH